MQSDYRLEHDSLGEVKVPSSCFYGVQTQRGLENWKVSGVREPEVFIRTFVAIKRAAANVNHSLKMLDADKKDAILKACDQILKENKYLDQFVIDVFQA